MSKEDEKAKLICIGLKDRFPEASKKLAVAHMHSQTMIAATELITRMKGFGLSSTECIAVIGSCVKALDEMNLEVTKSKVGCDLLKESSDISKEDMEKLIRAVIEGRE